MESFKYVDMFATKGIEYIFIISFLVILVFYWRYLNKPIMSAVKPAINKIKTTLVDWFSVAEGYYYHQGHTWAVPEDKNTLRVGVDDFAQKLVGKAASINLPKIGDKLDQGETGWKMTIDSKTISMLSPVSGEVIDVNQKVVDDPNLINKEPYKSGWLFKVKTPKLQTNLKNLLFGKLAKAWMEETVDRVGGSLTAEGGLVLQDGGQMVSGFAKEIDPENWDRLAGSFFMTDKI